MGRQGKRRWIAWEGKGREDGWHEKGREEKVDSMGG